VAFSSPTIAGLKAAIRAGLGITLRGTSVLDRGLLQLSSRTKLPRAPTFDIVLATVPQPSPATTAFAEFIKTLGARQPAASS
jgi:DNA-binding transcriptional LysR family regulator